MVGISLYERHVSEFHVQVRLSDKASGSNKDLMIGEAITTGDSAIHSEPGSGSQPQQPSFAQEALNGTL